MLNYVIPAEYDYFDEESNYRTVYSLTGTRKTVTVIVIESGANGEVEKGTKTYNTTVTVGEILKEYGYKESEVWVMAQTISGDMSGEGFPTEWTWNTVVTWPIRLTVYKY